MIKVTQFIVRNGKEIELQNETAKTFADLVHGSLLVSGTIVEVKFSNGSRFKAVSE